LEGEDKTTATSSLENIQQYSKHSQNLRQSVLILHEQSKEKTANAKCYTDQKVGFDKVVKVDVKR